MARQHQFIGNLGQEASVTSSDDYGGTGSFLKLGGRLPAFAGEVPQSHELGVAAAGEDGVESCR